MDGFKTFLAGLGTGARAALAAGVIVVLAGTATLGWWLLRANEQVLFADLSPQDAAMMVAELDRMKVPYRVGDGGAILVPSADLHATRLKLMSKELPLHGTAGFELFNNADFGVTEFAQKINYQRALQGEITRTIMSLSEVKDARVHLALPEEGLFKRSNAKPKAAVTLALRAGESLRAENIVGIQRLVASAVPGISPQDVTVIDQHGVTLSRTNGAEGEGDIAGARLDVKRETERHIARKVTDVLARAFGAQEVLATVDATLNMDQVRVTTEDVLGGPRSPGQAATGVIVRERESSRDAGPPLNTRGEASASNSSREVDYQVGRRVEQVATQPGAIRRLHVAAIVSQRLDARQLDQVRSVVAAAAGIVPERGDTVVVQSLQELGLATPTGQQVDATPKDADSRSFETVKAAPDVIETIDARWGWAAAGVLLLLIVLAWAWGKGRANRAGGAPARISAKERDRLLDTTRLWLETGTVPKGSVLVEERKPG